MGRLPAPWEPPPAKELSARLLLATRPRTEERLGLATFVVDVPVYIWTEVLTHRRAARNASSSRAQSNKRHTGMGYYKPPVFYEQGKEWMAAGRPLKADAQEKAAFHWDAFHATAYREIDFFLRRLELEHGTTLAKEQVNRMYPTTKMLRGLVTMTEAGWSSFLALRCAANADSAMQILAKSILEQLVTVEWKQQLMHVPFAELAPGCEQENGWSLFSTLAKRSAARCARISGGVPGPGQRSDEELADNLLRDGHLSPFEHACRWMRLPKPNVFVTHPRETQNTRGIYGWETYRAALEWSES